MSGLKAHNDSGETFEFVRSKRRTSL
jgi:hypothetical protein